MEQLEAKRLFKTATEVMDVFFAQKLNKGKLSRKNEHINYRHMFIWLLQETTDCQLKHIQKHLGYKNHSSIIHARNKIISYRSIYPKLFDLTEQIKKEFLKKLSGNSDYDSIAQI